MRYVRYFHYLYMVILHKTYTLLFIEQHYEYENFDDPKAKRYLKSGAKLLMML